MGRLREYQRGTLASGGASVSSAITLQGTNEVYSWNLDSVGNWAKTAYTPVGSAETSETRQHNKLHQIVKAGSTALAHDTSGNMTDDGSRTFEYDALNRVKTVTKKSGAVLLATYTYDAMGRRIRKVITGNGLSGNITNGTTDYLYDGQQCVEERVSDAMTKQYVWGLYVDELLEINAVGTKYYPLQDLLYRTSAITDVNGDITEAYDTDAYGRTIIFDGYGVNYTWFTDDDTTENPTCEFIFTGRRYDPESELYFYRARYYNPTLGRFISKDPLGYQGNIYAHSNNCVSCNSVLSNSFSVDIKNTGGMNLYQYVKGLPAVFLDPTGEKSIRDCPKNKRKRRPNYKGPSVNGCGQNGATWYELGLIREVQRFGRVNFTSACNMHDRCYGTCNFDKGRCDRNLKSSMIAECLRIWANRSVWATFFTLGGPERNLARCRVAAEAFYQAVSRWGDTAYWKAQDKACCCAE